MIRIVAPHFVAGVEIGLRDDFVVVRAAPILNYMLGWRVYRVLSYCSGKRWECEFI